MKERIFKFSKLRGGYNLDDCIPNESLQMHIHTELEIIYICKGSFFFQIEGSVYPVSPGDLVLMRMSEVHNIISQTEVPVYERITFHIDPQILKETLNGRLLKPFIDRPLGVLNHYTAAELPGDLIHSCIKQAFLNRDMRNEMQALSYLLPILQSIYDVYVEKTVALPADSQPLASQIIAYINSHLQELEGTHQLEKKFFLSISQINRIFHSFSGTSAWNYVKLKRLYAAREMLQSGVTPTVAAINCGYQDYSSFFRAYKKQFKHSPRVDYHHAE